ncbi:MAG TPA: sugar phosphate nucleotidyltransferase [Mycobacteriales bacterium]
MSISRMYGVIPAGGSGTRLWPLSRANRPKFLLDLGSGGRSLIQSTRARLDNVIEPASTYVVTGVAHAAEVARQLPELPAGNVLVEPAPRDSAPAIGLAAVLIHRRDPEAVMGSFAADHLVRDTDAFDTAVRAAADAAADGSLVTIGLTPTAPETGFGYIRRGAQIGAGPAYRAEEFKEKPTPQVAREYLADGRYLWNASMFVWRTEAFLEELHRQLPELAAGLERIADSWETARRDEVLGDVWPTLPKANVDQGVMEDAGRRGRVATVPASLGWNDVGDWDTLASVLPPDPAGVVRLGAGPVLARDSAGSLVDAGSDRLVALLGVRDLVVVDTPDALLVCPRDRAQEVRALVDDLRADGRTDLV